VRQPAKNMVNVTLTFMSKILGDTVGSKDLVVLFIRSHFQFAEWHRYSICHHHQRLRILNVADYAPLYPIWCCGPCYHGVHPYNASGVHPFFFFSANYFRHDWWFIVAPLSELSVMDCNWGVCPVDHWCDSSNDIADAQ
jgi:hypothetical protein